MKALDTFTPRYLKPADLNNSPHLVHIERVVTRNDVYDTVAQSLVTRHVLYLLHSPKGFMLNRTQTMAVVEATGQDDTDNWAGHSLIIEPVTNENGYPTIQVSAYTGQDPKEAGLHQFAPLPQSPVPTGLQLQATRRTAPRHTGSTAAPAPAPATTATATAAAATNPRRPRAQAQAS